MGKLEQFEIASTQPLTKGATVPPGTLEVVHKPSVGEAFQAFDSQRRSGAAFAQSLKPQTVANYPEASVQVDRRAFDLKITFGESKPIGVEIKTFRDQFPRHWLQFVKRQIDRRLAASSYDSVWLVLVLEDEKLLPTVLELLPRIKTAMANVKVILGTGCTTNLW